MSRTEYEKRVTKIAFVASMRQFARKVIGGTPERIEEFDASFVA